ncbi:MMPL family transporter [Cellulophaga baltica]|uniref:efflux RND transporter permease subunit n=1 Tax=Cellulophaga TaxID=104264 RepID=UPI001C06AF21|nr:MULTISPECIES: MMPL family transporter [Cellulophaga]MBU2997358.1 MMPL family transporter [Cellulophaga baltica]MDO6768755.1 MMPL family transporter [Cellulophaga sp. 1_MG-2023]
MLKILSFKKIILGIFVFLAVGSGFLLPSLKFSFDFSQFFPTGDDDLYFYEQFIKDFSTDDNFLLVGIENNSTVFEKDFLLRCKAFTEDAKTLPFVTGVNAITNLSYPLKTSFGYTKLPVLHINDSTRYEADWKKIQEDNLFIKSFVAKDAKSLAIFLETEDNLDYKQSIHLLDSTRSLLKKHQLDKTHLMGRTSFYEAMVDMQKRELLVTSAISIVLVLIVLFIIYKRTAIVFITLSSIFIALLIFLGTLAVLGKELSALAAFYPILMLIVGTSDVIHIFDNFLEKLKTGIEKKIAIVQSLKEVGLSTLLTSITTAIGFLSLLFSKLVGIRDFGVNSAIGVLIAYITVVFFTSALVLTFSNKRLLPKKNESLFWQKNLIKINSFTKTKPKQIIMVSILVTILCFYGLSLVNTNYTFKTTLPNKSKIADDFQFFQKNYSGFRTIEIAALAKDGYLVTDYEIAKEIEKVNQQLQATDNIDNIRSVNAIFKTFHKANNVNKREFYSLPKTEREFNSYKKDANRYAKQQLSKLIDSTKTKARIIANVLDIGTDSLVKTYAVIDNYVARNIDTTKVNFRVTGKGMLMDKNAAYIQGSLLQGLFMGLLLVGIIMAFLFKSYKLVFLSLIPNMLPLLFAGALLGFLKIPLDAPTSIVFAIVFGIAVDDTIHFLGKYKIATTKGLTKEEALKTTFLETGRALIITTLLLFFGFMVLLFSIHTPSLIIGLLISATLLTALLFDLLLLPVLIRKFM